MTAHQILTSEAHRTLRVRTERGADFGDAVMTSLVVPDEFRRLQAEYPILFRLDAARDTFAAYALFGFEDGENLFLEGDRWDAPVLPLAIEIQPFLIGGKDEGGARQVHIDTASPRLHAEEGVRLFDEFGGATPYLDGVAERLGALDAGYQSSGAFFATLRRHALLEPLMLDITLDDGSENRLAGFHAIDEDRLAALDGHALAELNEGGHLLPVYMAVASLARIPALIERKNRKARRG